MRGGEKVLERCASCFPPPTSSRWSTCTGTRLADHRDAAASTRRRSSGCRSPAGSIATTCRCSRSAIEQFDLDGYDLVISSQPLRRQIGGRDRPRAAPLLLPHADALRVGPVRRLLRPGARGYGCRARCCGRCWPRLARWDRATAGRVHRYLAISQYVARRIALYYNRQSTIVYPPVDTSSTALPRRAAEPCQPAPTPVAIVSGGVGPRALQAGRPGHRWPRAAPACALTIVGDGPERARLERAGR